MIKPPNNDYHYFDKKNKMAKEIVHIKHYKELKKLNKRQLHAKRRELYGNDGLYYEDDKMNKDRLIIAVVSLLVISILSYNNLEELIEIRNELVIKEREKKINEILK